MNKFFWHCSILGLALLLTAFVDSPQSPIPSWPPEPPDPTQLAGLEELSTWLSEPRISNRGRRQASPQGFRSAIKGRTETFELLRRYNGPEANREFLQELPYGDVIFRAAKRHGVDSLLLAAVVEAESNFRPHAVSPKGAVGLAQVMPTTAELTNDELSRPSTNLDLGARYLRSLIDRFDGDLELALAAYNAGPGNVNRYRGVPPFRETRNYLDKVLSIYFDHQRGVWTSSASGDALLQN